MKRGDKLKFKHSLTIKHLHSIGIFSKAEQMIKDGYCYYHSDSTRGRLGPTINIWTEGGIPGARYWIYKEFIQEFPASFKLAQKHQQALENYHETS